MSNCLLHHTKVCLYFHLLSVMLLIQLVAIAYSFAVMPLVNPYFSIPVVIIISIVLVGMRSLAVQLSTPFGNDSVDFDIEKFMKGALDNSIAHLKSYRKICSNEDQAVHGIKNPLIDPKGLPPAGSHMPPPKPMLVPNNTERASSRGGSKVNEHGGQWL